MTKPIFTLHDARAERIAADAAMEARHAATPEALLEQFNKNERKAADADSRVGLLVRGGRVVAYGFGAHGYIEGTVADVINRLPRL